MSLIIELTLSGIMGTMVVMGMKMLFTTIIAEGEMMAVMWIEPLLTQLILVGMQPPQEPPETRKYKTRLARLRRQGRWRHLWTRMETMFAPPSVVTRLGNRGMSKNEARTTTRSSGAECKRGTCYNRRVAKSMNLLLVTCMSAASLQGTTAFDSDSKQIVIDNCSSRCLTVSRRDFLPGTLRKCNVQVAGVGGTIKCKVKGTVSWTVQDDQGRNHDLIIPDTPMCEALPHRLLLPQHWAQEAEKGSRIPYLQGERPSCNTNAVATTLTWGRGKFTKTVTLDKRKNVAIMTTEPGIKKYAAFASKVTSLEPTVCCFVATGAPQPSTAEITDDDESNHDSGHNSESEESTSDDTFASRAASSESPTTKRTSGSTSGVTSPSAREGLTKINFQTQPNVPGLSIEQDTPLKNDQEELYRLHVRMGHLSFSKLKAMARRGDIPGRLQHTLSPLCAACQYGKATKKPWRTKKKNWEIKRATHPGECVSVDQVE
jgi:hypothetical protein